MNEITLILGALAAAMLIVVIYMAVKERETSRKLAMLEAGIETLNRELFKLQKELEESKRVFVQQEEQLSLNDEAIEQIVKRKLKPFLLEMEHLRIRAEEAAEFKERLESLEGKMRQIAFANDHAAPDEQKILQLHAQGHDSESIAKQLRLGKGEVELVLKFSRLTPSL
ncbi:MAG: hypothetical protein L3J42_06825 [Hydrogenimonas sp.]|nr:hypothetical protein [Hydrogenimonas sp.]